jgi:hypothetical protein
MHKNATKCNETLNKWCKNKHGASKNYGYVGDVSAAFLAALACAAS